MSVRISWPMGVRFDDGTRGTEEVTLDHPLITNRPWSPGGIPFHQRMAFFLPKIVYDRLKDVMITRKGVIQVSFDFGPTIECDHATFPTEADIALIVLTCP